MVFQHLRLLSRVLFAVFPLLLAASFSALAQPEAYNWKFGNRAGIRFSAGAGAAITVSPSSMSAYEGCATISDANGVLQCYTNGLQVWDRTGLPMPNGQLQGSDLSATQAALLLREPGQNRYYHLLNVGADATPSFGGVQHSIVDMSLRGGLGDVGSTNSVAVSIPGGGQVTEKLTAVLHANGRDYWVVVHGWNNNAFYCYLLSPGGLAATPVVSTVGAVHSGSGNGGSNAIGYLRASPNGRVLAAARVSSGVELFNFDAATGRVSTPRSVPSITNFYYGLEFSPDNSKLYLTNGNFVYQVDLANNFAHTELRVQNGGAMGLQRGPDDQIYLSILGAGSLAIIQRPNVAGLACNLQANAFALNGGSCELGLPNFPNAFSVNAVPIVPVIGPVAASCEGELLSVSTSTVAPNGSLFTWNFGDPASGAANTATGPAATHRYQSGGTYTITLTLTTPAGSTALASQVVVVGSGPRFSLGTRQQFLCPGAALVLSTASQPAGTTYRWQDGTGAATYTVRAPGRYVLRLTSPQGCARRDSVDVLAAIPPVVRLGRDTALCAGAAPLLLQPNLQPAGSTYRWADGTTAPTYAASRPGLYWLEVRNSAGCVARDTLLVRVGSSATGCPVVVVPDVVIPNIITPDGNSQNEFFVLKGLNAPDWNLTIYNRWGRLVLQQARYDNHWNAAGLVAGVYYYLLRNPATGQQYRGWVEVIR